MRLVGDVRGIGIALTEYYEPIDIPFVPSPFCNPDIKEHRRVEQCKDLKNNPDFRAVGTCKYKGCKGKKYYQHIPDNTWATPISKNGKTTERMPDK